MAASMRCRSRFQMSGGKAGSPSWREASVTARCSSAGSVSERRPKLMRSLLASPPKPAPRSAQASPSWFSSSAGSFPEARMPLLVRLADTLARPALPAGSRRLPPSMSTCTSTIGIERLSTKNTCAPLGCRHVWMGSAAKALEKEARPSRPNVVRVRSMLCEWMVIAAPSIPDAGGPWARLRVRVARQRPERADGELVIPEVPGRDGLHLLCSHGLQPVDEAVAGIQRQALRPEAAQFLRLVEHGVALVDLARDPLRLHALELRVVHAVTRHLRHLGAQRGLDLLGRLARCRDAVQREQLRATAPQTVAGAGAVGHPIGTLRQRAIDARAAVAVEHGGKHREC